VSFLLDTDICSAHLKGHPGVSNRVVQYGGQLYVSTITIGELLTWALRAKAPPGRARDASDFLSRVNVLDVDSAVAGKFGEGRARLMDAGVIVPGMDLLIAVTAMIHGL